MNNADMVRLALNEGFCAAEVIAANDMVFNGAFRKYCEDNVCGNYGVNHSCPPDCGAFEEMKNRMQGYKRVLVMQSKWQISDYSDKAAIRRAKCAHNESMFRVIDRLKAEGYSGLMGGASPCTLCEKCNLTDGEACRMPDKRFSCLSAYCIDVSELAKKCGMDYFCPDGRVAFFGVYAF